MNHLRFYLRTLFSDKMYPILLASTFLGCFCFLKLSEYKNIYQHNLREAWKDGFWVLSLNSLIYLNEKIPTLLSFNDFICKMNIIYICLKLQNYARLRHMETLSSRVSHSSLRKDGISKQIDYLNHRTRVLPTFST